MTEVELYKAVQKAGAAMTNEQISKAGREAEGFGIDKDAFMLLLISGKPEFKNLILCVFNEIFSLNWLIFGKNYAAQAILSKILCNHSIMVKKCMKITIDKQKTIMYTVCVNRNPDIPIY